jgi:hypothetical protein
VTIGHNPVDSTNAKWAIFLRGNRKNYLCEQLHERVFGKQDQTLGCDTLVKNYAQLRKMVLEPPEARDLNLSSQDLQSPKDAAGQVVGGVLLDASHDDRYIGESLGKSARHSSPMQIVAEQALSMRLYEARIASLQRIVAFFVLFHQMGENVQVQG